MPVGFTMSRLHPLTFSDAEARLLEPPEEWEREEEEAPVGKIRIVSTRYGYEVAGKRVVCRLDAEKMRSRIVRERWDERRSRRK